MKKTSQECEKTKIEFKKWHEELLSPKKKMVGPNTVGKNPLAEKVYSSPHIALK